MISFNINTKHRKTLHAVFRTPTASKIIFGDLSSLVVAVGGQVREGDGSRVVFEINSQRLYLHRPHPGKEAKRYQVEALRTLLKTEGIHP